MVAKDIPKQLDSDVLKRGDLGQLVGELVELLLSVTEFDEVLSLSVNLYIRLIKSLDALFGLKQLFDGNFNCGLACRNSEKLHEVFVSGKPLLDNFNLFANIVPQF